MICTPHRGSSLTCARLSCHPCMQCAFLFDFELSIPSNFLFSSFIFNLLHFVLHFFHNLEGISNTAYSAKKEMESYDESYLHTETNGVAERAVRRVKEGTSAVLLQSGLDESWWQIPWNALPICEPFKFSCLIGDPK